MRPRCLTGAGRADMESAPTVLALPKLHILYYLLSIIFYLYYLLLVLAVVAGLGADVNIIAGQMGAQAHILALVADSQA